MPTTHPPQAVLASARSRSRENDTQSFSSTFTSLRYPKGKALKTKNALLLQDTAYIKRFV